VSVTRLAAFFAAAMFALAPAATARAERCGPPVPWVDVAFEGESWMQALGTSVLVDLRAGMHARGIAVCGPRDPRAGEPGALVRVVASGTEVRLEVSGAGQAVGFARALDLEGLPNDGRAVAIASSIDEALRSNWAHLQRPAVPLGDDGTPLGEPTVQAERCPSDPACGTEVPPDCAPAPRCPPPVTPTSPQASRGWLGLSGVAQLDAFETGFVWIGGALITRLRVVDRFEIELGIGGGAAIPQETDAGAVSGERFTGAVGLALSPMSFEETVRVYGIARIEIGATWLRGHDGAAGFAGTDAGGWTSIGQLGAELAVALERSLDVCFGAWIGFALQGAHATEGSRVLTGLTGLEGGARLGLTYHPLF
jgi:hypothetical protein